MGLLSATVLVIANMIGTGIFTTSGFVMEALGDPRAMLLCWALGGLFALSGALCYGELGAMFPRAGGEYVFLRESFGQCMGFVSGWISLIVGFSAPIAAASMAFAAYLLRTLPGLFPGKPDLALIHVGGFTVTPATLIAVGIIVVFSAVHSRSLSLGSRVQNVLTLFKVAVILAFVVAGLSLGRGSAAHFNAAPESGGGLMAPFATSLILISFAYSGWNAAAYLGSEIRDPGRNIPLALLSGTLVVSVLYLLINTVFIYALPAPEMRGVLEVGAAAAAALFGEAVGRMFSMMVTLCLLSVISAMIMAGPRVYFAMAQDRIFFQALGRVSQAHGTPSAAILLQAVIAILMVLTATFEGLLIYIGFTLALFAMATVLGMMRLRGKEALSNRPYRTFGYPVTPLFFVLGNLWIIVYCIVGNPVVSLYGAGTLLSGILLYTFFSHGTRHHA